ncbi:MAG: LysR family transcriptional regulator substrate-binding protein, partial [Eggerthellaceae bacterium]|nr:LysR family transcriptional regulator substrate-binding protein [Eggerthellaceae bacterium]
LPKFVRYMEKEHPEVDLDLRCMEYGELIRAHRSRNVDVIVNMDFDPEAVEACDFANIYQDRLYVVVGKKHRLAKNSDVALGELAGERLLLPDEQAYPGFAQAYERIVRHSCDASLAKRYKDIDTFYLRIAQGNCIGFSSGHNYRQFEGRAVFLPLVGIDTSYTVSAQWLKGTDERIVRIAKDIADVCAEYMQSWSDGVGA